MAVKVVEKNLQMALVKAAGQLGTTQDQIKYRVLSENQGFLGMFGKKVSIEAWKLGDKLEFQSQKANREKRDLSQDEIQELVEDLRSFCEELCVKVADQDVEVEATLNEGRLLLNVKNDYISTQMSKNTKLAEAMEHVMRKKPRHLKQELPFRVFVDANGVRKDREAELMEMAKDLSEKVHENRRPIVLNYRSSYDRKIIHMALDKDEKVYTKSIGTGPNRKLMILPSKNEEEAR